MVLSSLGAHHVDQRDDEVGRIRVEALDRVGALVHQRHDRDAGADDLQEQRLCLEDAVSAQPVEALDEQVAVRRHQAVLDGVQEGPQPAFLGVLAAEGRDVKVAEVQAQVEEQAVLPRVALGQRELAPAAVAHRLLGRAEPQVAVGDAPHLRCPR